MRRRYRVPFILGLCAVGAGVVRVYFWAAAPAVTKPTIVTNVQGASTQDFATKQVSLAYITADFPTRYSLKRSTDAQGNPIYLQQIYTAVSQSNYYSDQLALTIGKAPPDGVKGVSDVQMRASSKDYTQLFFQWLPDKNAVAYERTTNGYELGVFMGSDKYYVDIVTSGIISNKEQMIHEMQVLVSSLLWK